MSTFDIAIITLLKIEGGFVDDPNDPGGQTKYGISLKYLNSSLDATRLSGITHLGPITKEDIQNLTPEQASNIYKVLWWDKFGYSNIQNQPIATKVLCSSVNIGSQYAHICLQRAIRSESNNKIILDVDGLLGQETLEAVNNANAQSLLCAYKSELAGYYRSLHNADFIAGWLNRAYS